MSQLSLDSALLEQCNVMDYSLLLGVRRNIHRSGGSISGSISGTGTGSGTGSGSGGGWMGLLKHLLRSRGREENRRRTRHHNQDQGGVYSSPEDSIYYMGIIDILQKWNTRKKAELTIKRVSGHICFWAAVLFLAVVLIGFFLYSFVVFFCSLLVVYCCCCCCLLNLLFDTGAAFFIGG